MDTQELSRQVKMRRQKLGLSQETLAKQADISRNYLSIIERGEAKNVSVGILGQLATALGTTPAELSGEQTRGDILIPPSLREFSISEGLTFSVVDRLARLPRRGQEPKTVEDWRKLYRTIRQFLEEKD
jgi:transcriptional regulator with XRE-family HTH domain